MKKIVLIVATTLLCVCLLTACGEKEAYDLYADMNAAISDITSMQAKMDAKINVQVAGESVDMTMLMDMKEIVHSETDVEMAMTLSMDMGELGAMDMTVYFKDGWMYQEAMGMKVKTAVSLEDAMELVNTDAVSMLNFGQDAVSQSEVKDVAGGKQLTFTLNGDKLTNVLTEMVGSMMESISGGMDMSLTFNDVSYLLLLDANNLPKEQHISFSMDMDIEGETATASYDMKLIDLMYNNVAAISYPTDLDDYEEMTE